MGLLIGLVGCVPAEATPCPATSETARPTVRIMPLGDSITQGVGSSTGAGYRGPLQELLGEDVDYVGSQQGGPIQDPDHEGHSGYTIDQIREGIDGWLAQAKPDVVLLHIGINDLDRGDRGQAADKLLDLVDRIEADRPGVTILAQGLIPTTGSLESQVRTFNNVVRAAADSGFIWVEPPALAPSEMADRLHPNDQGYERMSQAFARTLSRAAASSDPRQESRGGSPCGSRSQTETGRSGSMPGSQH